MERTVCSQPPSLLMVRARGPRTRGFSPIRARSRGLQLSFTLHRAVAVSCVPLQPRSDLPPRANSVAIVRGVGSCVGSIKFTSAENGLSNVP
jgi:hypothetical protein